jgi:hypothetical protein
VQVYGIIIYTKLLARILIKLFSNLSYNYNLKHSLSDYTRQSDDI